MIEWVLQRHPSTPKTRAKQWILAGRVRVHGQVIRRPHQVMPDPGDGLELLDRQAAALDCGAGWQIHASLALLHLDTALAVVNKGAGLLSVPAPNSGVSALDILTDFLAGKLRNPRSSTPRTLPAAYRRFHLLPVHRLDQYTTGVFCMATSPEARQHLIEQLRAHTMKREYVAFALGRATTPRGTWRHWLELSEDEMRQQVLPATERPRKRPEAREAVTHFEVLAEYPLPGGTEWVTKLRLRLETGLKHQIRLQAAEAGLPLVGDRRYNPRYQAQAVQPPPIAFPRQALHADLLSLEHPSQPGQIMSWKAALPKDLCQLEAALRPKRP